MVRRFVPVAAFVVALFAGGVALAADDPVAAGRELLKASSTMIDGVPGGDIYTPELAALWSKVPEERRAQFTSNPDLPVPELTVVEQTETTVRLDGSFNDGGGKAHELVLDLQLVDGEWKIADFAAADDSFRLSTVLAAAGTQ